MAHSFPHALWGGFIIAICCSFLGTLVVLKRLVFIGATLSQVAACGIAAGFFYHLNPIWGAVALNCAAVTMLASSAEEIRVPRDAIMASLFILASSLSILFVSKSANGIDEVQSLLYGDLIITSASDLKILLIVVVPLTLLALLFLRPIVYTFVDREEARILGVKVRFWELFFYYILGIVVSAASKLGGMLLVFCYLVVPPMAGLLIANRLLWAMILAVALSVLSTFLGFSFSYVTDLPTNQAIAVISCILLCLAWTGKRLRLFVEQSQ